jgi:hypothetical protein
MRAQISEVGRHYNDNKETLMLFFENGFGEISYDDSVPCAIGIFKQYATGNTYREPLEKLLELMQQEKTHKLIIDAREVGVISQQDQTWHETNWLPRFIQAGGRYAAMIPPKNILAKMSVNYLSGTQNVVNSPLIVQFFNSFEEAREWLLSIS